MSKRKWNAFFPTTLSSLTKKSPNDNLHIKVHQRLSLCALFALGSQVFQSISHFSFFFGSPLSFGDEFSMLKHLLLLFSLAV
jgi:hypothetical protein